MTRHPRAGPALRRALGPAWLAAGFLFLYVPIATLVLFSFNASQISTVWGGASLRWYRDLARDHDLISALWLSLRLATLTASSSVVLGTLAALALSRFRRFRGRAIFGAMLSAPLVMPEVIIGLSLLLFLVSAQRLFGFPERGLVTIWLGHTLLGIAYATVVVQARLETLGTTLEEAAADLGARPPETFLRITLPLIAQSLGAAWLLTFTLSLDDVVVSAFLSGPGSTTLPLVIFSRARLGQRPDVNAAATIIILVVAVGVAIASLLVARAARLRAQETLEQTRTPL